ncbi:MAG: SirB1 family protein [Rhodospirillaceae bacterium]
MITSREAAISNLQALLKNGSDCFDLAEAALLLAALDAPTIDIEPYRNHLKAIYMAVAECTKSRGFDANRPSPSQMGGALSFIINDTYLYRGDVETYDDLDNANLMRVIDRRKGLPVSLGILYIAAAKAQGWNVAGLNFPGHFLVRLEDTDGNRSIIDPFHDGHVLDTPALRGLLKVVVGPTEELNSRHYKTVSFREILLRLQNNVKTRRLDLGQMEEALETLETMKTLWPDSFTLYREIGILKLRLGQIPKALTALEVYLARAPFGAERERIETVVQDLKHRIH